MQTRYRPFFSPCEVDGTTKKKSVVYISEYEGNMDIGVRGDEINLCKISQVPRLPVSNSIESSNKRGITARPLFQILLMGVYHDSRIAATDIQIIIIYVHEDVKSPSRPSAYKGTSAGLQPLQRLLPLLCPTGHPTRCCPLHRLRAGSGAGTRCA